MRLPCPDCGPRDVREFYYQGAALTRPDPEAPEAAWHDYVHLRENPAGDHEELWSHDAGCGGWIVVTRNLSTHVVKGARRASEAAR